MFKLTFIMGRKMSSSLLEAFMIDDVTDPWNDWVITQFFP